MKSFDSNLFSPSDLSFFAVFVVLIFCSDITILYTIYYILYTDIETFFLKLELIDPSSPHHLSLLLVGGGREVRRGERGGGGEEQLVRRRRSRGGGYPTST